MKTKYHPILFSTPMVQAIDENRKMQTRRTKGLEEINKNPDEWEFEGIAISVSIPREKNDYKVYYTFTNIKSGEKSRVFCPYNLDDVLWVRESFYAYGIWIKNGKTKTGKQKWKFVDHGLIRPSHYRYLDNPPSEIYKDRSSGLGYYKRNSFFMPKKACRFFLKIKSIRAERIWQISEEDAIAEGIEKIGKTSLGIPLYKEYFLKSETPCFCSANSFRSLWKKINGEESWYKNPFVWVYEFEKIAKPEDFI